MTTSTLTKLIYGRLIVATNFPTKSIRHLLHALGISHTRNNSYVQPNTRYSPYPTSNRNYFQTTQCNVWDKLVDFGYAKYHKADEAWRCCYSVTDEGKSLLRELGYKWHEPEPRRKL